ncbi:hypothetical protein HDU76_006720, partial [Blyttiomyces sp. JEL0837]
MSMHSILSRSFRSSSSSSSAPLSRFVIPSLSQHQQQQQRTFFTQPPALIKATPIAFQEELTAAEIKKIKMQLKALPEIPEPPKKPWSSYLFFFTKYREEVSNSPEILELEGKDRVPTTAKLIGERWRKLSDAEKEPYENLAAQAKAKYEKELAKYIKIRRPEEYLVEEKRRQLKKKLAPSKRIARIVAVPNAPSKPLNAYAFFTKMLNNGDAERKGLLDGVDLSEFKVAEGQTGKMKVAAKIWTSMSDKKKK